MTPIVVAALVTAALAAAPPAQVQTELNRQDALRHYRAGEQALHTEKYDQAEREFGDAIKLDPLLALAHYGLGQVHMATKRFPRAVRAFLDCRAAFTSSAAEAVTDDTAYQQRIDDQIRALEDAKHGYEMGIAKTANTQATIQRLDMQINQMKHQRHRGADRPVGTPAWISIALGSAYFRTEAMADAEREYQEALKAEPNLGEAHNNLAVVFMLTGRYDAAEQEVKAAEKNGFRVNPQFKEDLKKARARS